MPESAVIMHLFPHLEEGGKTDVKKLKNKFCYISNLAIFAARFERKEKFLNSSVG